MGMTSTFAALNADLLHRMGPRVVVVEEAGELLECQLMACLASPKLQQVLLIIDPCNSVTDDGSASQGEG